MTTATQYGSAALHFRSGPSDKEYHASVEPEGIGFIVRFAFGRRGSTLQTGVKTAQPVTYQEARKIFDKLVREKMAKGYTPGADGTPYQGTERGAVCTGILPQLLNPIDADQAERLIADDGWWAQEKFDGKRMLIRKDGEKVEGINRKGFIVSLPRTVATLAATIGGEQWIMDGEAIGDTYVAFDLLEQDCADLRRQPYRERLEDLRRLLPANGCYIRLATTACYEGPKRELLAWLRQQRKEGIVFKRYAAPYIPGRPASGGDALKLKFTATASCIVAGSNGNKRSVALVLLDRGMRVPVGSVTVPPNQPAPAPGSIVEVRYLYAIRGGSLYQPLLLGVRDDIGPDACTLAQLKYKADKDEQ